MISTLVTGGLSALLGTSLVSRSISTSLDIISGLLSFLVNGNETNVLVRETKNRIEKMDIQTKLNLVKFYMSLKDSEVQFAILLRDMDTLIGEIEVCLKRITDQIDLHNNKWFSSYRQFDVSVDLEELDTHVSVLDDRLKKLITLKTN